MAPGAITVGIFELTEPDPAIDSFGLLGTPKDWWIVNCGVSSLYLYSFDDSAEKAR
jgi:hypothetical protein